jgi:predicted TIM-barrel fold metal-dependent hydrolase
MIIDCHAHVFPPQIKKNRQKYVNEDPCFAMLYSKSNAKLATTNELISSMDRSGIAVSIIVNIGWTTHDLCLETNDYILESITRYPDRLIGFCSVQPLALEAALMEIERCAKEGARGIGELRPDAQLFNLLDDEITDPLVKVMRHHKLIMLTHASEPVGHDYPGKGMVTPDLLYHFILSHPSLPLICAHWGGGLPFYTLMPEVKKALENVFFDTAASSFLYDKQVYSTAINLIGANKILYGSDFPLVGQGSSLKEIASLKLPPQTEEQILGGNAATLLGIEER